MKNLKPFAVLALLATLTLNALPVTAGVLNGAADLVPSGWMTDADGYLLIRVSNIGGSEAGPSKVRVWHYTSNQIIDMNTAPAPMSFSAPYIKTNIKLHPGFSVLVVADCFDTVAEDDEANARVFSTK